MGEIKSTHINKCTAAYALCMTVYMFEQHVKHGVFRKIKAGNRFLYSVKEIDRFISKREKMLNTDKGGAE